MDQGIKGVSPFNVAADLHTAGSDTIFVQIYMDPPPGVPGVSKNQIFFSQMKLFSFCAKIAPKRHKLQKSCLVDSGASFDTPGTPGGGSI